MLVDVASNGSRFGVAADANGGVTRFLWHDIIRWTATVLTNPSTGSGHGSTSQASGAGAATAGFGTVSGPAHLVPARSAFAGCGRYCSAAHRGDSRPSRHLG